MKHKISQIKREILENYLKDSYPWVIGYSGGKDSTLTVELVLETIAMYPNKEIYIVYEIFEYPETYVLRLKYKLYGFDSYSVKSYSKYL